MKTVPYAQAAPGGYNQGYVRRGAGRPKKESSCCASFQSLLSTLILIGILAGAGVYLFLFDGLAQLQALFGFGGATNAPISFPTQPPAPTAPTPPTFAPTRLPTPVRATDYIQLQFLSPTPLPTPALTAFENARVTWSTILAGNEFNLPFFIAGGTTWNDRCGSVPNNAVIAGAGGTIDHLLIAADTEGIDGSGGTLGFASPCTLTARDNGAGAGEMITVLGRMVFDTADLVAMESAGTLENVILHEMGHVIGIGTLWDSNVENPVFSSPVGPGTPGNQPIFNGHAAMQEYAALVAPLNGTKVPVEDGSAFGDPTSLILAGEGRGSIDGHWRETVFSTELMTPLVGSGSSPLSAMSIRSLEDIGYAVDVSPADAYTLPSVGLEENPQALVQNGELADLRGDIRLPKPYSEMVADAKKRAADAERRRLRGDDPGTSDLR